MKKEKTIKITEFDLKPELIGAIIKYITMITVPIPRPNPKPDGIPKPKKITLAEVVDIMNKKFDELKEYVDARFDKIEKDINDIKTDINNIVLKNNLKR
jgi:hypothetical protein